MKKSPLFFVILSCIIFNIQAQEIKFGVKGGLNSFTVGDLFHRGITSGGGNGVTPVDDFTYRAKNEESYHIGGFVNVKFGSIIVRPEFVLTTLKNSYPLAYRVSYWTSERTEINVLIGYEIYKPATIYLGPSLSTTKNMELSGQEVHSSFGDGPLNYKENTVNFNAGIMFDFKWFGIDFRYQYGTEKFKNHVVDMVRDPNNFGYGTNLADLREYNPSQFMVSLHLNPVRLYLDGLLQGGGHNSGRRGKFRWRQ